MNLFMISWYVIDLFLHSPIDVKRYPLSFDRILIAAVFENQVTCKVACNEYFKVRPTPKYSLKKRQIASRLAICIYPNRFCQPGRGTHSIVTPRPTLKAHIYILSYLILTWTYFLLSTKCHEIFLIAYES